MAGRQVVGQVGGGGQVGRQVREQGVGHSGGQEDRLGQGGRV